MEALRPGWAVRVIIVMLITAIFFRCVAATNHSVGGASGWDLNSNVLAWSAASTFQVGDYLGSFIPPLFFPCLRKMPSLKFVCCIVWSLLSYCELSSFCNECSIFKCGYGFKESWFACLFFLNYMPSKVQVPSIDCSDTKRFLPQIPFLYYNSLLIIWTLLILLHSHSNSFSMPHVYIQLLSFFRSVCDQIYSIVSYC